MRPRLQSISIATIREIGKTGLLFLILQVVVAVAYASDYMIISQMMGPAAVPQYAVPEKMFSVITALLMMTLSPLWPAYAEAIPRGDIPWIKRTLAWSVGLSVFLSLVGSCVLLALGNRLLTLWIGRNITVPLLVLSGLAVWKVLEAGGNAVGVFLNGAHVVKAQVWMASITAVFAIVLKIFLIPRIGVSGVVWATVIAYAIFAAAPMTLVIRKTLARMQNELVVTLPVEVVSQ